MTYLALRQDSDVPFHPRKTVAYLARGLGPLPAAEEDDKENGCKTQEQLPPDAAQVVNARRLL